ncbi:MAG: glycoside hydrolase family 9 protein, partial [Bacteroidales bacterium]|nr:glycoside hydrolase family 9 protein [Bacteroidales bacterium]
MKRLLASIILSAIVTISINAGEWIRINQLGYLPDATKVAVYMSNDKTPVTSFKVIDIYTGKVVYSSKATDIKPTGKLGEMNYTARLNFSAVSKDGAYKIVAEKAESPTFPINPDVFNGTADFVLNYMRQQRCGWNPFMKDSCHVKDGYIEYHPTKSGQHIDVRGGWHDASDCLQYTTTSANAIYQMMFAYQQNPEAFGDTHKADGTPGANGIPDIIDEIYWGLDWLDRMNPEPGEFYNQIADDRDHVGMREPANDQADYGWGPNNGRPVYFVSGEPQQRGQFMNATTGTSSTVGKFASDFALGSKILAPFYPEFAKKIGEKAEGAYQLGIDKPGVCQTASVRSPYIYEEDNWVDDMELGALELYHKTGDAKYLSQAIEYARREPVTPWMGADSARHYQWYPFMNMGHYHLAKDGNESVSKEFIRNLRSGIQRTYEKAVDSPFLYGIPSVWCSNNLTAAMLTQCILYRQLTGDTTYQEMEGSLRDWLLGCNPWGVSMIVELPRGGVYPTQPHSFIINLDLGNTTGGLVDGPVYSSIFGSLTGVSMDGGKNYMEFQPGNMVYHDSTNDYSTNEPTMDGTASLTFPFSAYQKEGQMQSSKKAFKKDNNVYTLGGIERTDPSKKTICLVFTAADKADGEDMIISTLKKYKVKGSFFFTGEFYEKFPSTIKRLVSEGHYVGSHSYGHLLYAPWENRDSTI